MCHIYTDINFSNIKKNKKPRRVNSSVYLQTGFIFIVIRLVAIAVALWQLRHHPEGKKHVVR